LTGGKHFITSKVSGNSTAIPMINTFRRFFHLLCPLYELIFDPDPELDPELPEKSDSNPQQDIFESDTLAVRL